MHLQNNSISLRKSPRRADAGSEDDQCLSTCSSGPLRISSMHMGTSEDAIFQRGIVVLEESEDASSRLVTPEKASGHSPLQGSDINLAKRIESPNVGLKRSKKTYRRCLSRSFPPDSDVRADILTGGAGPVVSHSMNIDTGSSPSLSTRSVTKKYRNFISKPSGQDSLEKFDDDIDTRQKITSAAVQNESVPKHKSTDDDQSRKSIITDANLSANTYIVVESKTEKQKTVCLSCISSNDQDIEAQAQIKDSPSIAFEPLQASTCYQGSDQMEERFLRSVPVALLFNLCSFYSHFAVVQVLQSCCKLERDQAGRLGWLCGCLSGRKGRLW